jgi:hypothetical protein
MDITVLETACRASGMLDSAISDGVRRLREHFSQMADPSAALIAERLGVLREEAQHLWPQPSQVDAAGVPAGLVPEVWRSLSPSTKLTWLREHGYGLTPVERRAKPVQVSPEQTAAFAAMKPQERMDAYRALQAQQQP